jgi:hypothetical protein
LEYEIKRLADENKRLRADLANVQNRLHLSIKENQKRVKRETQLKDRVNEVQEITMEYKKD